MTADRSAAQVAGERLPAETGPSARRPRRPRRLVVLIALGGALVIVVGLSLVVGNKGIPVGTVLAALRHPDGSTDHQIVRDLRVPRTLLGLAVGVALGLAGTLMQSLTRNPLADPGILGINAGCSAAVVAAIALFGLSGFQAYVWFAFAGAALSSLLVYALAARGRGGATPVRLALAGTAVAFAFTSFTQAVITLDARAFNEFRFWIVGSLAGRPLGLLADMLPFLAAGVVLAFAVAGALNALALGDDAGRALGARVGRTRGLVAAAVVLLCGTATAAAGPIAFIGLVIPHVTRSLVGHDHRWQLPYAMLIAPIVLLLADVIGRVVLRPGELQVGIVTAFVGAPLFIGLVSRRKVVHL